MLTFLSHVGWLTYHSGLGTSQVGDLTVQGSDSRAGGLCGGAVALLWLLQHAGAGALHCSAGPLRRPQ